VRETARTRQRVEAAEAAIKLEQEGMETTEHWGLTTREPEKSFHEMMVAIGDSLSDIVRSDDGEDGEDENDEETEQGNLSEDEEPSWVKGTISKTVQHRMERFRQMQIKLDELTTPGWGDSANYFRERDKKYGTAQLRVVAVFKPQTDQDVTAPGPTTFTELM
jgi:hypothetical protein